MGIYVALSLILASITTNLLKYQVFENEFRPYFVYQYQLRYEPKKVDGVELMILKSFPSGHATQSFAIFFAFALAAVKQHFKLIFFTMAILGALSRVYLSQHWLQDITAGSVIGVFFALVCYMGFYARPVLQKLNKPLAGVFKK
jgi:membrane-associated phospholipid phosphatase